jgi:aryl-alcohol dehydrogenase-like predicted oxidoreductase
MTTETTPARRAQSATHDVTLGSGLTRLGRPWGVRDAPIPTDAEAQRFLETALAVGVCHFDTAPSYGASEERLGRYLKALGAEARRALFVATKFGEQWDAETGALSVDHSYEALARSLEVSLRRLEHARIALDLLGVGWLQFPYHEGNGYMVDVFALAEAYSARVVVNRPFGMGALLARGGSDAAAAAFRFILKQRFRGVILSGTASPAHLRENVEAIAAARRNNG